MDLALEFSQFRSRYAREFMNRSTQWEEEVTDGRIITTVIREEAKSGTSVNISQQTSNTAELENGTGIPTIVQPQISMVHEDSETGASGKYTHLFKINSRTSLQYIYGTIAINLKEGRR